MVVEISWSQLCEVAASPGQRIGEIFLRSVALAHSEFAAPQGCVLSRQAANAEVSGGGAEQLFTSPASCCPLGLAMWLDMEPLASAPAKWLAQT